MYRKLKGICKEAIEKELCLGCSKLELESFEGVDECKYVFDTEIAQNRFSEQIRLY